MKKIMIAILIASIALQAAVAQNVRAYIDNQSILDFRSDAEQNANTGFNYVRNETRLTVNAAKFRFQARIRIQAQPTALDRTFNSGLTFLMGTGEDGSGANRGFLRANTDYIRATAFIMPFTGKYTKPIEFAIGTNINYYDGTTTDWTQKHWSDTQTSFTVKEYLPRQATNSNAPDSNTSGTDYFASNGNRAWAERGIAVKYALYNFDGGVFIEAPQNTESGGKTNFQYRAGLRYTMQGVFSIGTSFRGNTLEYSQQMIGLTTSIFVIPNVQINLWGNYNTANDSYVNSMIRNPSSIYGNTYSKTQFASFGISGNVKIAGLTIEPDFAVSYLFGEDYKKGYYNNDTDFSRSRLNADLGFPFYIGLNITYPVSVLKGLTVELFSSYTQGALAKNPTTLLAVYPQVSYKFKAGTLTAAFNMRWNTANISNPRTTYFGWEVPISWTVRL